MVWSQIRRNFKLQSPAGQVSAEEHEAEVKVLGHETTNQYEKQAKTRKKLFTDLSYVYMAVQNILAVLSYIAPPVCQALSTFRVLAYLILVTTLQSGN